MVWRLRLHRIRRYGNRVLVWAGRVGMGGMVLTLAISFIAPGVMERAGMLVVTGCSLLLSGIAYALVGEAPTLAEYAAEKSEAMPGIAKLCSGLLASVGGMAFVLVGVVRLIG